VKIIDIDLDRRRISLSIKQAAEGGVVAAEYQEHYGEHAYDEQGNYIGPAYDEGEGGDGAVEAVAPEAEAAEAVVAEAEAPEAVVAEAEAPEALATEGGDAEAAEAPAE
jgi:small subunit ribosomal protein S1